MKNELTVIYNGSCPICSREVAHYRNRAERFGAEIRFLDLATEDPAPFGLTRDTAARRFYAVAPDGQVVSGIAAFAMLWRRLPGLGWLAGLATLPGLRVIAEWAYDKVAAPALYALHRRRNLRDG